MNITNPGRKALYAGIAVFALVAVNGSWFTVDLTERAGVRTLGNVVTTTPLTSGFHFKVPFFSSVDYITVSQTKIHIDPFLVNTIDNQPVGLEINILYKIPDASVFRLMYNTGTVGSADISQQLVAVVRDRASRVITSTNTVTISANREAIQSEITAKVKAAVLELFGIEVESLQIPAITYSQSFIDSNNLAVQAKNSAVAEENKKKVIEYQAQQRVIAAEGYAREKVAAAQGDATALLARANAEAQQAVISADANAKAVVTQAEANKKAVELNGQGEAARLVAVSSALGGSEKYLETLRIGAATKWNGSVPSTVMNMGGTSVPFMFNTPLPTATTK